MRSLLAFLLLGSALIPAASGADRAPGDAAAIAACLTHWEKHPFAGASPRFRVFASGTQVLGVGSDIEDLDTTGGPSLVLVKPGTSVLTKKTIKLLNPQGWYCLKGTVAVLGKVEITLACQANLASSAESTTVLGSNEAGAGVTALGSVRVQRVGCANRPGADAH